MVVESVNSVNNIPLTNNFVLPAQNTGSSAHSYKQPTNGYVPSAQPVVVNNMSVPQEVSASVQPQQAKSGNKNMLWWVLGGLAVAGTAGILIYNLRKGRTNSATGGSSLGDFAKKFVDQSILTKTLERANVDGSKVKVQSNADKSVIAVCDDAKGFGAQIITKFDNNAAGKVSEFDFATSGLELKVANFDNKLTHVDFGINEVNGFVVKVDSNTGKIVQETGEAPEGMKFLMPRAQKLVDDLDPKKLLDDDTYRTNYVKQVYQALMDSTTDFHYDKIATASGKTIDDVKVVADGSEFKGLCASRAWFSSLDEIFALGESPFASNVAKSLDDCDETWTLLEKMMKGEVSHKVTANYTVDGLDFPKKNCFKIDYDNPENPYEMIKMSDDGEYFSYTRRGRSITELEDYFELELYEPKKMEADNFGFTRLASKDATFSYKENADGVFDMQVSVDGKRVDVADDVLESFQDKSFMESFLKEFATKGKENIMSLFSVS